MSFLGGLFVMSVLGITINTITLIAFLMTVGLIMDNNIVITENIDKWRRRVPPLSPPTRPIGSAINSRSSSNDHGSGRRACTARWQFEHTFFQPQAGGSAVGLAVSGGDHQRVGPAVPVGQFHEHSGEDAFPAQHAPVIDMGLAVGLWNESCETRICASLRQKRSLMSPLAFCCNGSRYRLPINGPAPTVRIHNQ